MKKYVLVLWCAVFVLGFFANTIYANNISNSEKPLPKVLMLIIASDQLPVWVKLQTVWKRYMNIDPKEVEVYFIKGDPHLGANYKIRGNEIWSKTQENFVPGILNKTILSIEAFLPRMKEFDYVVRTNLSSFYVFSRLQNFLQTLPKTHCYCAYRDYIGGMGFHGAGSNIILSSDVAQTLVMYKSALFNLKTGWNDDVILGRFFEEKLQIPLLPAPRIVIPNIETWNVLKNAIPEDAFHFRIKNDKEELRAMDEVRVYEELVKHFYGF